MSRNNDSEKSTRIYVLRNAIARGKMLRKIDFSQVDNYLLQLALSEFLAEPVAEKAFFVRQKKATEDRSQNRFSAWASSLLGKHVYRPQASICMNPGISERPSTSETSSLAGH